MHPIGPRLAALAVVTVLVSGIAGCAGESADVVGARASAVSVLDSEDLGEILVDGAGSVLYVFEPDDASTVSCTFTCANNWPPFAAVGEAIPAADGGADSSLIGVIANPSGGDVVTYNGWPLYRYAADKTPGEHRGQDAYLNGGEWYVMTPEGEPLVP